MKSKSFYHIPLSSLQWLLTGLFLAAIPLRNQIPAAVIFGFLGCMLWRFILERRGLKCPPPWARIGIAVAGLLMILGLHGTLVGITAGMGFLLLLVALKVLEMKSEREFVLLAFLAFFILLTTLFFSQSLMAFLYVGLIFILLTATLIQFTGGASEGLRLVSLLRYTGVLVLQALPLIVLLFVFLPRMKGGLWFQVSKSRLAQSGMSEQINPGSFAVLAMSEEVVFRADFPEGAMPPLSHLYWRVGVFSECNGLTWGRDTVTRSEMPEPQLTGPKVVQRISMEPHTGSWVYALDRPESGNSLFVRMGPGNVLTALSRSSETLPPIRVVSRLGNDRTPISDSARRALTYVPEKFNGRSRQLVNSWLTKTNNPRALVALALGMFRDENFRYTLSPGIYSDEGLDQFLFDRKLGFCEHYAASFATLMRMAGVPARVVGGYHGGELNTLGDYLIVRQADAHAWSEVWIEDEGWVRFDPADSVNPSRMDDDTQLASRHNGRELQSLEFRRSDQVPDVFQTVLRNVRQAWDTVNFQFNMHVISYDQASQLEFYHTLGITKLFSGKLIGILLGGSALILAGIYFWVRPKAQRKDRSLVLYHQFCHMLERVGMKRGLDEGPEDFSGRAMQAYPQESVKIAEVATLLIQLRYGKNSHEIDPSKVGEKISLLKRELRNARLDGTMKR